MSPAGATSRERPGPKCRRKCPLPCKPLAAALSIPGTPIQAGKRKWSKSCFFLNFKGSPPPLSILLSGALLSAAVAGDGSRRQTCLLGPITLQQGTGRRCGGRAGPLMMCHTPRCARPGAWLWGGVRQPRPAPGPGWRWPPGSRPQALRAPVSPRRLRESTEAGRSGREAERSPVNPGAENPR